MIRDLFHAALSLVLAASFVAPAQTNPPASQSSPRAYDAVSIKVNNSGLGRWGINVGDYSYQATNIPLKELLSSAYGIKSDLISGLPGPIDAIRFDVDTKIIPNPAAPRKLTDRERPDMLKAVLVDRFGIKAHLEVKTLPVFDLVVGHSGPKIKPSPSSEGGADSGTHIHPGALTANNITMAQLASTLIGIVHRQVVDKTGFSGNYDVDLRWTPDTARSPESSDAAADAAPNIFTAVQDQLGLKLQPSKGPVDTLVIDHTEMPTEN
jgi:uncharacterized protein (TIGR03435 family)